MIVVSDATPLNVLIRIGLADSLAALYGRVIIPPAVRHELTRALSPSSVRNWISSPPAWLEMKAPAASDAGPQAGRGEREALALAQELGADRLLAGDRKARLQAERAGIKTIGTLGLLELFSSRHKLPLAESVARLPRDFRIDPALIEAALEREKRAGRRA